MSSHRVNRQPNNQVCGHVQCKKVPRTNEHVATRVFVFTDVAGLRECLSQDRRGRARTLPDHLKSTKTTRELSQAVARHPRSFSDVPRGELAWTLLRACVLQRPSSKINHILQLHVFGHSVIKRGSFMWLQITHLENQSATLKHRRW